MAIAILGLWAFALRHSRPAAQGPLEARLVGFTNGVPGGTVFGRASTNYAAFIREWYASGTNVAVIGITNRWNRTAILYPYIGFFASTNAVRSRYESLLLNAPTAYGVFLRPGQGTLAYVGVLPGKGPGRARLGYTADYTHFLPRAIEQVRGFVNQKPADFGNEWIYTDRIDL